jgi:hypothetical protein
VCYRKPRQEQGQQWCSNGAALRADKDGGVKKGEGGNSKWKITPLEENVTCMTECLIILGKNAKVKVTNLVKVMVESGKDDPAHVTREIKEQINQLEEEPTRPKQNHLGFGITTPPTAQRPMLSS